jgi:hypothetical protein
MWKFHDSFEKDTRCAFYLCLWCALTLSSVLDKGDAVSLIYLKGDACWEHVFPLFVGKETHIENPGLPFLTERRCALRTCICLVCRKGDACWEPTSPLLVWKETWVENPCLPCFSQRRHFFSTRVSYEPPIVFLKMHLQTLSIIKIQNNS